MDKALAWMEAELKIKSGSATQMLMAKIMAIVENVVLSLIQTTVDNYKKTGTWDAKAAQDTLNTAKDQIIKALKDQGIYDEAIKAIPDLVSWITTLIEATIAKSKIVKPSTQIISVPPSTNVPIPGSTK
jgi:phosphoserine aminotransferase